MMTVKVRCGCGQNYAFDVEPVGGRMPTTVACPVCGVDGTAAANEIIAQSAPPPPIAARLNTTTPPIAPAPATPAAIAASRLSQAVKAANPESDTGKWKWWYWILAGVCIGGYSIWQAYTQHTAKPLGELFLAVFAIAIGIWSFVRKRDL